MHIQAQHVQMNTHKETSNHALLRLPAIEHTIINCLYIKVIFFTVTTTAHHTGLKEQKGSEDGNEILPLLALQTDTRTILWAATMSCKVIYCYQKEYKIINLLYYSSNKETDTKVPFASKAFPIPYSKWHF